MSNKSREFWIDRYPDKIKEVIEGVSFDKRTKDIHVIEYSAYHTVVEALKEVIRNSTDILAKKYCSRVLEQLGEL